jgi:hypothetical protein
MTDTPRLRSALVALFPDNTTGEASPQDLRDLLISVLLRAAPVTYSSLTPAIDDDDFIILLDGTSNTVTAALPNPASGYYPVFIVKAINIDNAVALDPGALNLEGAATDYTFATVNDCIIVFWDGSAYWIAAEFLNA